MISISVKHNIGDVISFLDDRYRKQLPFATALALTKTAQIAQPVVVAEMSRQFDRPTPFTLKSLFVKPATKQNLQAMIYLKDQPAAGSSKSLAEILGQEFAGGTRIRKRLESALQRGGLISSNEYVAPMKGAILDAYGNMSRGQIQQILSQLQIGIDRYSHSTKNKRSLKSQARAGEYFWSYGTTPGHNGYLPRGVWLRKNNGHFLQPVLLVISTPHYRQRIDLEKIVGRVVTQNFDAQFALAMEQAMRSAGKLTNASTAERAADFRSRAGF